MTDVPLTLESIGDAQRDKLRLWYRGKVKMSPNAVKGAKFLMSIRPFVKLATGVNYAGIPTKKEIRPKKSYDNANGMGQRGVLCHYVLRQGMCYFIQRPISHKKAVKSWVIVNNGELHAITREQVAAYLSNEIYQAGG